MLRFVFGLSLWLSGNRICLPIETQEFDPWVSKSPWRRVRQPTPGFLPGESRGQRSLVGYSPWSHKESDTTEWLSTFCIWTYIKNFMQPLYIYSKNESFIWTSGLITISYFLNLNLTALFLGMMKLNLWGFLVFAQVMMSRATGSTRRNQGERVASPESFHGGKRKILLI